MNCPECGSDNIYRPTRNLYICDDCGHIFNKLENKEQAADEYTSSIKGKKNTGDKKSLDDIREAFSAGYEEARRAYSELLADDVSCLVYELDTIKKELETLKQEIEATYGYH